jgi:hypothetical protein
MGEALFEIVLAELGQIRDPRGPLIGSLILFLSGLTSARGVRRAEPLPANSSQGRIE